MNFSFPWVSPHCTPLIRVVFEELLMRMTFSFVSLEFWTNHIEKSQLFWKILKQVDLGTTNRGATSLGPVMVLVVDAKNTPPFNLKYCQQRPVSQRLVGKLQIVPNSVDDHPTCPEELWEVGVWNAAISSRKRIEEADQDFVVSHYSHLLTPWNAKCFFSRIASLTSAINLAQQLKRRFNSETDIWLSLHLAG